MAIDSKICFCDLHCDTVMALLAGARLNTTSTQVNIPFLKKANIAFQLFACYLPPSIPHPFRSSTILKMLDKLEEELDFNSKEVMSCKDFSAATQAINEQKIAAMLTIENGMAIENNIKHLEMFFGRGVRLMTIVHAESHDWAISSNDKKPKFNGLTNFGEQVIAAMNEMGMIIDVSHAHDCTVKKVLSITKRPAVASHSCVYALCQNPRNLNDKLIQGIADTGGLIGITFFPGFLDSNYYQNLNTRAGELFVLLSNMERKSGTNIVKIATMFQDFRRHIQQLMMDLKVSVDRIINHADYIIKLVGEDFVAFGSDFVRIADFPEGVADCRGFNLIKDKLFARGYSQETIEKISYKNFLRVLKCH